MPVVITDEAAAYIQKLWKDLDVEPDAHFRIRVVGNGCSGFTHKVSLDENFNPDRDDEYVINGIRTCIDRRSVLYIKGLEIDYYDDGIVNGFAIVNPNFNSGCACSCSGADHAKQND